MRVKALWFGGTSYALPDPDRDLEVFASLKEAREAFEARADNFDRRTPCVDDETSEMHVYFGDYSENGPDRIVRFGPRKGVIVERA